MQRVLFDLCPASARLSRLLLPDDDLAVVRARREDVAVLRVRPGDLPDRSGVPACLSALLNHASRPSHAPFQSVSARPLRLAVHDVKHFHHAVGRARRESLAIVV